MNSKLQLRPAGAALGAAFAIIASLPATATTVVAFLLVAGGIAGCVLHRSPARR
jgi:hypothetical protein